MEIFDTKILWKDDKKEADAKIVLLTTPEECNLYYAEEYDKLLKNTSYSDNDIRYYANATSGEKVDVGVDFGDFTVIGVMGREFINDNGKWDYEYSEVANDEEVEQ